MPIHYRPDFDAHIAHITAEGQVTYDDCLGLIEAKRSHVPTRLHEIFDYRNIETAFEHAQVEEIAGLVRELYANVSNIRFAVVVDTGLSYGMSRMFDVYLDQTVEFEIFEDYDAAYSWVNEAAKREAIA